MFFFLIKSALHCQYDFFSVSPFQWVMSKVGGCGFRNTNRGSSRGVVRSCLLKYIIDSQQLSADSVQKCFIVFSRNYVFTNTSISSKI